MDIKEVKEFSTDAIYGLSEMVTLINAQTQEIEYFKDKIIDITTTSVDRITYLESQIDTLTESFQFHNEDSEFDGEVIYNITCTQIIILLNFK